MNVSAWSIRNPLVAVLLFILLSLGGWHGFHAMRVQQFPDMDFPVVVVSVALTGASPQQLESDVAKKVESRLASLDGVKNVRSTLQTGLSTTVIEFRLEKDLQEAVDEVRSAVGEIRSDLPADALDPVISKVGTSGMPLLTFSVAAQGMDALSLSWFVDDRLSRRLLGIPGVGSVSRVGGLSRTVEVLPDPVRLKALGLPISAVAAQVAALQRDVSGGEAQIGGGKQSVRALGGASVAVFFSSCGQRDGHGKLNGGERGDPSLASSNMSHIFIICVSMRSAMEEPAASLRRISRRRMGERLRRRSAWGCECSVSDACEARR